MDFEAPRAGDVPGQLLGSSQGLVRELTALRDALEIPVEVLPETESLWEAASSQGEGEGWEAYGVESVVCVNLACSR